MRLARRVEEMRSVCSIMVKRQLYHVFPMLSQGVRHQRGVCVQRVGL